MSSSENLRWTVDAMVTHRCNFRCAHCMYSCSNKESPELEPTMLYTLAQTLKKHTPSLAIFGGEPTLAQAFAKNVGGWAHYYAECFSSLFVATNGSWMLPQNYKMAEAMDSYCRLGKRIGEFSFSISDDQYHRPFWKNPEYFLKPSGVEEWASDIIWADDQVTDEPSLPYLREAIAKEQYGFREWSYHGFKSGTKVSPRGRAKRLCVDFQGSCCLYNLLTEETEDREYDVELRPDGNLYYGCCLGCMAVVGRYDSTEEQILEGIRQWETFLRERLQKQSIIPLQYTGVRLCDEGRACASCDTIARRYNKQATCPAVTAATSNT